MLSGLLPIFLLWEAEQHLRGSPEEAGCAKWQECGKCWRAGEETVALAPSGWCQGSGSRFVRGEAGNMKSKEEGRWWLGAGKHDGVV